MFKKSTEGEDSRPPYLSVREGISIGHNAYREIIVLINTSIEK
jgi:hypothetical protein